MIESVHDLLYICIADRFEVGALGKILTNQAIRVFIKSALPGMIWMGEIYLSLQRLPHPLMGGKFFAVIGGNGMGMCLIGTESINRLIGDFVGLFGHHLADHRIARPTLHQGNQGAVLFAPHHQINLPIPHATFLVDHGWPLLNADPVTNLASGVRFSIAFPAFLMTLAQMRIQTSARLAIGPYILVDPLMTQRRGPGAPQPTANLFGTPLLAQFLFYLSQHLRRPLEGFVRVVPTLLAFLLGLTRSIAALAPVPIKLTRDRRGMHLQIAGNGVLRMALFLQRGQLVSLVFGQLMIFRNYSGQQSRGRG